MLKILLKYIIVAYLFLFINIPSNVLAQEKGLILSKYYSAKDYKASPQNWCIAEDNRGILYFGNTIGIVEYDGVDWRNINVLNNSTVRCLSFDEKKNILYAGGNHEIGFLAPNNIGDLAYNSLNHLINSDYKDFGVIWDIQSFSDSIFFLSDKYIFLYHDNSYGV